METKTREERTALARRLTAEVHRVFDCEGMVAVAYNTRTDYFHVNTSNQSRDARVDQMFSVVCGVTGANAFRIRKAEQLAERLASLPDAPRANQNGYIRRVQK